MTAETMAEVMGGDGLVPVFHSDDAALVADLARACHAGGLRVFEYTNRSDSAPEVFGVVRKALEDTPGLSVGAGSMTDGATAARYLDFGADFVVSAHLDAGIADVASPRDALWIPGCGTVTEIATAERLGARIVKVFPGSVLGPGFIKAVRGPRPWSRLMPTGGVTLERENLQVWIRAGVVCVGIGSALFSAEVVARPSRATPIVREALALIQDLRRPLT